MVVIRCKVTSTAYGRTSVRRDATTAAPDVAQQTYLRMAAICDQPCFAEELDIRTSRRVQN